MIKNIKIKCPAKINLTLEIVNKRPDGFHNIKSIMQTIDLYDYLTINTGKSNTTEIKLNGSSNEIPYNEKNLVYKACLLYIQKAKLKNIFIDIFIEKHIPISAGLAGGSTDAAGTILGLNQIFNKLSKPEENLLCAELGSDLNVCLNGGAILATSRGEIIQKLPDIKSNVTLIKPKNLGISAKEAYTKYSEKTEKPKFDMTEKMLDAIKNNQDITPYLYNDLEYAVFDDYEELQHIKKQFPESIMSGSGSTYYILNNSKKIDIDSNNYLIIDNLNFTNQGVALVN